MVYTTGLALESASATRVRLALRRGGTAVPPTVRAILRVPAGARNPRVTMEVLATAPGPSLAPCEASPTLSLPAQRLAVAGAVPVGVPRSGEPSPAPPRARIQRLGTNTLLLVQVPTRRLRAGATERIDEAVVDVSWERAQPSAIPRTTGVAAGDWLQVRVDRPGIYRIRQSDLAAAGLDISGDPALLQLTRDGVPVPIHVAGESDGSFDADDFVELYAQPFRSRYSDQDVYELRVGTQPGARMPLAAVAGGPPAPLGALAASRLLDRPRPAYNLGVRNGAADNFFVAGVTTATAPPTLTVSAPGALTASPDDAVLTVDLLGFSTDPAVDPDHRIAATWNGVALPAPIEFDGQAVHTAVYTIPMASVLPGANDLVLAATGDTGAALDAVYVDAVRLDYVHSLSVDGDALELIPQAAGVYGLRGFTDPTRPSILDVTDPAAPVRLSPSLALGLNPDPGPIVHEISQLSVTVDSARVGARIAVASDAGTLTPSLRRVTPTDWSAPTHRADYVVITPAELSAAAERLVAARAAQGLAATWVDVQALYDELGYGRATPDAVRRFIQTAATTWQAPTPRWFLLLGDGTFDYKQAIPPVDGDDNRTLVPVHLYDSPFFETATDNWFADVVGDDDYPDVFLGRIPAATAAEADTIVDKILAYEARDYSHGFEERFLVAADDVTETWETLFADYGDELAASVPPFIAVEKVYLGSTAHPNANVASAAINAALLQGVVGANYFGHGARDSWAAEDILTVPEVLALTNDTAPTFLGVMNCLNGLFQLPNAGGNGRSLGEVALTGDGGAVGFVGTTSLAYADPQVIIDRGFWTLALDADPITVGEALTTAKQLLDADTDGELDVLRSWVLLGDPAMTLRANHRPTARLVLAGTLYETGATVALDASGSSDPDVGQALTYQYQVLAAPAGAGAAPSGTGALESIVPDRAGSYTIQLTVSDGLYTSEPVTVSFEAQGADVLYPPGDDCLCDVRAMASPRRPLVGSLALLVLALAAIRRRRG